MNKKITISLATVVALAISMLVGILIGKGCADVVEVEKEVIKTEWKEAEPIHDTIYEPKPVTVHETDTFKLIVEKEIAVDTSKILSDYYLIRQYDLNFGNDTVGKFKVNLDVTRNRITNVTSEIRPIVKVIEKERQIVSIPAVQFYGMVGTSVDLKTNKIQLGVDLYQKYLIGISGLRMDDKFGYTIDVGIKF